MRRPRPRSRPDSAGGRGRPPAPAPGEARSPRLERGVALGFLAMLPLFAAYEAAASRSGVRNLAEVVLTLPLARTPDGGALARRIGLVLCTGLAAWSAYRSALGLLPRLWRVVLEGFLAAVLLGPALLGLSWVLGALPAPGELPLPRPGAPPPLERAAFLAGGAAWEEIAFRVGLQSLLYVAALHLLRFLSESERLARAGADALSIPAAALCFSVCHLAVFTQVLGPGGEAFDRAVFTWRLSAGILLGALFRWRGPGVAAWTHALFNLALLLGAGPEVFL